jgi:hypothetical protein
MELLAQGVRHQVIPLAVDEERRTSHSGHQIDIAEPVSYEVRRQAACNAASYSLNAGVRRLKQQGARVLVSCKIGGCASADGSAEDDDIARVDAHDLS